MSEQSFLALTLLILCALTVLLLRLPITYTLVFISLLALEFAGYRASHVEVIESAFSTMYLFLVILTAFDQLDLVSAMFLGLLLMATRDSLHIVGKGALAGVHYVLNWYMPLYIALTLVPLIWESVESIQWRPPSLAITLTVAAIVYVIYRIASEATP